MRTKAKRESKQADTAVADEPVMDMEDMIPLSAKMLNTTRLVEMMDVRDVQKSATCLTAEWERHIGLIAEAAYERNAWSERKKTFRSMCILQAQGGTVSQIEAKYRVDPEYISIANSLNAAEMRLAVYQNELELIKAQLAFLTSLA